MRGRGYTRGVNDGTQSRAPIEGDIILIRYGNGTQVARVTKLMPSGYKIDRFRVAYRNTSGHWVPSNPTLNATKCLGLLPSNDPRRLVPGF